MLAVGCMDFSSGVLLVVAPLFTLRLMGLTQVPAEPIFLSWIGVFVGVVGAAYGLPYLLPPSPERELRLRTILLFTAMARLLVGLFVTISVVHHQLERGWLLVAATDFSCGLIQLWMLREHK